MSDSTIIEVLLAVLALVVGYGSYIGSTRASRTQATAQEAEVDAEAFHRAQSIYESAIKVLEGHIITLKNQTAELDVEVSKLRQSNLELRTAMVDLTVTNTRLETELKALRRERGEHYT